MSKNSSRQSTEVNERMYQRCARERCCLARGLSAIRLILALAVICALPLRAQSQDQDSETPKPIPVFSAGMGFITQFEGGQPHLDPLVSPIFLVPIGSRWLIESRDTFESDLTPPPGSGTFRGKVEKEVDYLQLDFIANSYFTVTAGRFLTPFGIYNERLYPIWIRDLQSDPLILPIAVGPSNASTGAMVRGGFSATPNITINYAAYFSTLSTISALDSDRTAGGRAGVFLPKQRLEIGGSFQHLLQDDHSNSFGLHFAWQPPPLPLDIRGEYARSATGSGYWIESAYRLTGMPLWQGALRHLQAVGRMQQFNSGRLSDDDLPEANTRMFEFGLNYYFRDNLRYTSSYGRQFVAGGNENIWTVGFTYRFAVPLGPGETH
jgi:hypothetical protein